MYLYILNYWYYRRCKKKVEKSKGYFFKRKKESEKMLLRRFPRECRNLQGKMGLLQINAFSKKYNYTKKYWQKYFWLGWYSATKFRLIGNWGDWIFWLLLYGQHKLGKQPWNWTTFVNTPIKHWLFCYSCYNTAEQFKCFRCPTK